MVIHKHLWLLEPVLSYIMPLMTDAFRGNKHGCVFTEASRLDYPTNIEIASNCYWYITS